ncbi:MAG: ATP-binding protein [Microcella pacifica]|uniref:ATP-binding protein n=1 Tax=Microcella pacifica TaxID=2591847 RepID=UPI0033156675
MSEQEAKTIEFDDEPSLGRVFRVDTANVWVLVHDDDSLSRVSVGSLVAVQSSIGGEHLVGTIDRVTRAWGEDEDNSESDKAAEPDFEFEPDESAVERNLVRVSLLGTYTRLGPNPSGRFKRGADAYPRLDAECWVLDGDNLEQLMGLVSSLVPKDLRLEIGSFLSHSSSVATADGNKWFQRHAAVLGSTGSGKSWAVALFLERASKLQFPNLIVLDMHGEYISLTTSIKGSVPIAQSLRVAGAQETDGLAEGVLYLPWWLLTQEELFALLLDRSEDNAPNQAARFGHHLRALKEASARAAGRDELADRLTIDSPVPADLDELIAALVADDTEMVPGARGEKQGPFHGKLSRFIARLEAKRNDRRYAFMFSPPAEVNDFQWIVKLAQRLLTSRPGVKVIDFSRVPGDVLPVVVGVLARVLYQVQFWMEDKDRTPFTFVCDEAHLYLPAGDARIAEQRALDSFERIAKEGRKYGVSLMVVSQRPSDVSRTVLSQCNNFMILRLTNEQDRSVVQRLVPDNLSGLTDAVPLLDIGEAIILGDSMILPSRIKLAPPTVKPVSATRDFWTEWNTRSSSDSAVELAIANLRAQGRTA